MPNRNSLLALASLLIAVLLVPSLALAQDEPSESTASSQELDGDPEGGASDDAEPAGGRSADIEEVIQVEGARSQGLKEVPISVTQFGASDIQNLRIQNVADLSAYTPNLEINTSFAASNPTLFIRGVGLKDYNSNSTGAVSIWQDGIMMNSPAAQLFSLYDIESIEVLRGPVGGVGGRNASAGQIRIHSFKPNGEWTADGSFSAGNLNLLQFEGALGFPIFPDLFNDTLSARVAVTTEFRDGYTNNVCSNWDPGEFGYLPTTQEVTEDFYELLQPDNLDPDNEDFLPGNPNRFPNGRPRPSNYIYRNIEAVELYNSFRNQFPISIINVDGERVGQQAGGGAFRVSPDDVCLLNNSGTIATDRGGANNFGRGQDPPQPGVGIFKPNQNVLFLDDFQGLQKTYNNIEYYASRVQLLWEPGERWSFLANFHWGANRGDAFHQQPLGTGALPVSDEEIEGSRVVDPETGEATVGPNPITRSPGYYENPNDPERFSEINEAFPPFERPVPREGLSASRNGSGPDLGRGGADIFSGFYSDDGKENLDLMGAILDATFEPDWGRIVYVGGYEFNSRDIVDEGGGCPCRQLFAILDDETWQFSNDLRVLGGGYGFDWTLGFFQLHEELESFNQYPSSLLFSIDQNYEQITDAWNVGLDLHYDFLEDEAFRWLYQISFDGGFRYNWEQKEFTLGAELVRDFGGGPPAPTIEEETIKGTWHGPAGEATLSILPVENARLYGKFTRGLKAGHFNAGLTVQPDGTAKQSLDPVAPEGIYAVEVGLKSSWWEDRIELSGAFFRYWYEDLQVFDIVNEFGALPTQQLLNADADVMGAEAELTVRPLDGLLLQVAMGWLDTSFGEFIIEKQAVAANGMGGQPGVTAFFNYEGNPLIAAPTWSLSGYAEYELPLYRWGSLVPSFNFSYKSRTYLDPQMEPLISQPSYWLFGARLAYRTPGGAIEVAGWVKNFLDQQYKIDVFDLSRQFGQVNEVWAEPRTFGVTITYAF